MLVYRISRTKFADDLSGEGARLFGGRWNHKGIPCLYTASSISLAILEYSVHVSLEALPRALAITTLKIPDEVFTVPMASLPGNWDAFPPPASSKTFGSDWLTAGIHLVIRLPSSIIAKEYNFLVNPRHAHMKQVKIMSIEDFSFDTRIKQ